ncbi:PadR family transcriptional regulator [Salibacterium sp. K-3]
MSNEYKTKHKDMDILELLYYKDMDTRELARCIRLKTMNPTELEERTLYAILQRLEDKNRVRSYWRSASSAGRAETYYTLTSKGQKSLRRNKKDGSLIRELAGGLFGGGVDL